MSKGERNTKKNKRKNKVVPKSEFRYNFTEKHKTYIFAEVGNKYKSLGITHKSETFGRKNMKLDKNPQNGKSEPAYIRNGIISDKKNNYGKRIINNLSFSKADFARVKAKIRHYKKRFR